MVLQKIVLKDGVFESIDSEEKITNFSSKRINVGNWCLKVEDDGSVVFKKNYWSFFRLFSVVYSVDRNGLEKLVIKRNGETIKTIKKRKVLPHGQKLKDGIFYIETAGDYIVDILFKNTHLIDFRRKNYLTEIVYKDPNGKYVLRTAKRRIGYCRTKLDTDGKKHLVNKTKNEEVKQEEVSIVNATWVILEIDREEYDEKSGKQISKHTRELITLKDPLSIKNLNVEQLD